MQDCKSLEIYTVYTVFCKLPETIQKWMAY